MHFSRYALFASVSVSAVLLGSAAYSLPQGGAVAAGSATIASSGPVAIVTQGSDRAVIDWRSFDVGAGEAVTFKQPSASSVTLNRIHDQKPSEIFGRISANGQVILSNPNGMLFGKDSRIDVAGLVATSASAGTDAFMHGGRLALDQAGQPDAKIINHGTITAKEAGLVALVAPSVENTGTITARLGLVQLAGAETAAVDLFGDGLVAVAVTGKEASTSVTQSGRITAGRIVLTAVDAAHLLESVVNTTGVLEASDARVGKGGTVVFGGRIELTGRDVTIGEGARIHADGRSGGGIIKIGGGWQGRGTIPNARNTTIVKGAVITANANEKGQGGTIAVWADQATRFGGRIEARGGPKGGHGGSIETSGKEQLGVTGTVDTSAPKGSAGDWLLDPQNVTISGTGANSVPGTGGTYNPSGATNPYTILDSSISAALSGGNNVTITTVNAGQSQQGDITFSDATILKSGGGDATLKLKANNSILTSGTNSISSNTGKLHTIFWSDAESTPNNSGAIHLGSTTITTNGGDVIMGGGRDDGSDIISSVDGTTVLFDGIAGDGRPDGYAWGDGASMRGVLLSNGDISSGGGDIRIRGHGMNDVSTATHLGVALASGSLLDAGSGSILLDGMGGDSSGAAYGISLNNSGTMLQSTAGGIELNGNGGTSVGNNSYGVLVQNNASIDSPAAGVSAAPITIHGKGGGGAGGTNYGVALVTHGDISSEDGDIRIVAVGGTSGNSNYGFRMNNSNITSSGHANIIVSGTGGAGTGSGDFYIGTPTSLIGGTSATGTITFLADKISSFTDVSVQTQGDIVFRPRTPSTTIGVSGGTCGSSCTLQLSDAGLATLSPDVDGDGIGTLIIGDSAAGTGTVDINGWDFSGKTYDVEVYGGTVDLTGGPVTWNGGNDLTLYSRTGNFVIDQSLTRNAGTAGDGTLTLKAADSITAAGTPVISAATSGATGKLHTILWSDANNDQSGYISLTNTIITSNGGDVILGGGVDSGADILAATDSATLLYDGIAGDGRPDGYAWGNGASTSGVRLTNGDIATGTGNIIIRGHGMDSAGTSALYGIYIRSDSLLDANGLLMIDGVGGDGLNSNHGMLLNGLGSILQSASGDIVLNGTAGPNTGGSSMGILLQSSAAVTSNGVGGTAAPIRIYGKGGSGAGDFNYGIMLQTQGLVSSKDGDIAFTAVGGNGVNSNHAFRLSNANVTSDGDANITISGTKGPGSSSGDLWIATPSNIIGGPAATGTITFVADKIGSFTDVSVQTQGNIVFKPRTASTTIGISGGSGGLAVASAVLDGLSGGNIVIGDATAGLITVNPYASWASRASSGVSFLSGSGGLTFAAGAQDFGTRALTATTAGPLAIDGAVSGGTALLQTTGAGSDITIGAAGGITASNTGNALILASSRNFINHRGAAALSAPVGRWLVYSGDPAQDTIGGLGYNFQQFSCTYGGACGAVPTSGNVLLYRYTPPVPTGGSSGGGPAPTPPVTPPTPPLPPIREPGSGQIPTSPAPVITTGLPDFIRKQDIATRIQVEAPLHGTMPGSPAQGPSFEDGVTPAATQEETDSRVRADDRRRRWFNGELYTVSPDLARDLEGE